MNTTRMERVQRQLFREVTSIVKEELKDPRIGFVTVMGVQLSPDSHYAKVNVSIMGEPEEQEATFQVLNHAAGFVRAKLGERMRLRYTPEIHFFKDDSIAYSDRIYKILDEIHLKEKREH